MTRTALLAATLALLTPLAGACAPATEGAAQTDAQTGTRAPARSRTTGLDPALLNAATTRARALPRLNALLVLRDGRPVFEQAFRGPGVDTPVNIKSASKSVLAALAGAAIHQGVLTGVDQPIAPILGPRVPAGADPRVRTLTVGHLLSMQAGQESTSGPNYGRFASSPDWTRFVLSQPFVAQPGGTMIYSTGTSHVLSTVLTRASGRSTLELARAYLGRPLGIDVPAWSRDPQGVYFGGNEMSLSPRALARFGELYRNDGVHAGRRILPEGWVQASWTPRGVSRWSGNGYGYGWWTREVAGRPVHYAWGYGGQMVYVIPDLGLTVVMTSDPSPAPRDGPNSGHVDALHALLDQTLIPAAERGAPARVA